MTAYRFRATQPREIETIQHFLAGVFRLSSEAPEFDPKLMRWKYYEPRPGWSGSRSYVLERDGEIVSHGCVWPMPLITPSGTVTACQIIDWAASPRMPGAGMLLRREIEQRVEVSVAIGGSPDSLKVLPGAGYKTVASFRKFALVVRPWRQFQRRPSRDWRGAAKLGRNIFRRIMPIRGLPPGWSVRPFDDFVEAPAQDYAGTARSRELYQYLLSCPSGHLSAFALKKGERGAGFFLLNHMRGQTRLVDLQVHSGNTGDWQVAAAAVTHTAARLPETCEIVASSSLPRFAEAFTRAGYSSCALQSVFLLDRSKALSGFELHITPADFDDFFADFPDHPFAA